MKHSVSLAIGFLALLAATCCTALPMANEEELVSLDSMEQGQPGQARPQELPHILKIAPKQQTNEEPEPIKSNVYDTIVEQLRAAGVHTSEQKPLNTLSYKELTRLLALWHMAQGRNYYEAGNNRAQRETATAQPIPS
ncbi:hypothetical protein AWZ03_014028 [Drosophila navojoa]|uniref:Uncharacterized protein n=1 Tax=Drosophila navojoa TaxID=7232 RepID=A0A484AU32_DRONA|nr:uncharacterized protein LOC115565089 [Drosophila navojoa]TDG39552.1 hypothetical protein AWZ03_014028 [Drosophila navojoa]